MATLPDYVTFLFDGYGEGFDPAVNRTEMERGRPKQSTKASQVLMKVPAQFYFTSYADALAFETWYFDVIKRTGQFSFTHPATGQVINGANFVGGDIGQLVPASAAWFEFMRTVQIEYLRG